MHHNEMWQKYTFAGEPIMDGGRSAELGNPHPQDGDNFRCGIAIVILYRFYEDEYEILLQQRSPYVDNPEKWDVSAGGHINYGEHVLDAAVREAKEEIGAEIQKENLVFCCADAYCNIARTFVYDWTGREEEFSFDDQEVIAVQWVKMSEFDEFWDSHMKKHLAADHGYRDQIKQFILTNGNH